MYQDKNSVMYFVDNGLVGMKRDVILRLIRVIKNPEKIRSVLADFCSFYFLLKIMGMCGKTFVWKSHFFFLKIRRESFFMKLEEIAILFLQVVQLLLVFPFQKN
jgi:hypothetical protein